MYSELYKRNVSIGDLVCFPSYGRYMDYAIVENIIVENIIGAKPAADADYWKAGELQLIKVISKEVDSSGNRLYKTRRLARRDYSVFILNAEEFYSIPTTPTGEKEFVLELIAKIKNGKRI